VSVAELHAWAFVALGQILSGPGRPAVDARSIRSLPSGNTGSGGFEPISDPAAVRNTTGERTIRSAPPEERELPSGVMSKTGNQRGPETRSSRGSTALDRVLRGEREQTLAVE
jgi:hypothetical protein